MRAWSRRSPEVQACYAKTAPNCMKTRLNYCKRRPIKTIQAPRKPNTTLLTYKYFRPPLLHCVGGHCATGLQTLEVMRDVWKWCICWQSNDCLRVRREAASSSCRAGIESVGFVANWNSSRVKPGRSPTKARAAEEKQIEKGASKLYSQKSWW